MTLVDEIAVGGEPWQVAIDRCGTTAYVILRRDQSLIEITDIPGAPALGGSVAVGSEPTGLGLTPNNSRLYVANWVDGTLTVVDPATMTMTGTVDLNAALVEHPDKFLGDVAARPALAHPRSIAITSNGDNDDDDEKVYVTEYFAQRSAPEDPDGLNGDINWVGVVYDVKVSDDSVSLVQLPPIIDTGFVTTAMQPTGCFPNQVQSITIEGDFAYVSSICASPVGPVGPKVNTHPLVSVIDTTTDTNVFAGTSNLTRDFDLQYTTKATPDTSARRFPHFPVDIAFSNGAAYVAANGADALFRAVYDPATSALESVGNADGPDFIDLSPAPLKTTAQAGQNPVGVVAAASQPFAFVANDVTMNVSAIDLAKQIVAGSDVNDPRVTQSGALPVDPDALSILRGKHAFNTGLGRYSFNGQAWGSCQSCHADGLTDNVTWYFARGARQSTSLEGSFSKADPTDQRIFLWTAVFDEISDTENNTRGVSGGVGALVSFADEMMDPKLADRIDLTSAALFPPAGAINLNGSTQDIVDDDSVIKDWNDITRYVQSIRAPRRPSNLDPALVASGEALFKNVTQGGVCQGCHGGIKWTISRVFYDPSGAGNEALKATSWDAAALIAAGFPAALLPATTPGNQRMRFGNAANDQLQCIIRPVGTFGVAPPEVGVAEFRADMVTVAQGDAIDSKGYNPPSLLGVAVGAPYYHAGNARTLEEVLSPTFDAHRKALTKNADFLLQPGDVDKLVAYLLSIDGDKQALAIPPPGSNGGDFCQE
jgi:YVTN family beta-propeller protein